MNDGQGTGVGGSRPAGPADAIRRGGSAGIVGAVRAPATVPMPGRKWATRVGVPGAVVAGLVAVLGVSGWESVKPRVGVRVATVVVDAGMNGSGGATPVAHQDAVGGAEQPRGNKADGRSHGSRGEGERRGEGNVVQAPGWIEAEPFAVGVAALVDGVVENVLVLEGERIEAGQEIARLVDADAKLVVERRRAQAAEMEGRLMAARANLTAAETEFGAAIEVTRSVASARAALAAAEAGLAQAEAELAMAQDELTRKEKLAGSVEPGVAGGVGVRIVSEGEMTRLRLGVAALASAKAAAAAAVREAGAERSAAERSAELRVRERLEVDRAKADVSMSEAGVMLARAELAEAALALERTRVRTPVGGVIQSRLVEPGMRVMAGGGGSGSAGIVGVDSSVVARVYDPARVQVRVDVPLSSAGMVGVGQRAEVQTEAMSGRVFEGVVTRVVPEANLQKNTVQIKVSVKGLTGEEGLRPEMLCRVRVFTGSGEGGGAAGASGGESAAGSRGGRSTGAELLSKGEGGSAPAKDDPRHPRAADGTGSSLSRGDGGVVWVSSEAIVLRGAGSSAGPKPTGGEPMAVGAGERGWVMVLESDGAANGGGTGTLRRAAVESLGRERDGLVAVRGEVVLGDEVVVWAEGRSVGELRDGQAVRVLSSGGRSFAQGGGT